MYSGSYFHLYIDEWFGGPTEFAFDVDDALPLTLADTSDLVVTGVVLFDVADQFDISVADAAAVAILTVKSVSDSVKARLIEQSAIKSLLARDDQLRVKLNDILSTFVPLSVDELIELQLDDQAMFAAVVEVADALGISFEDAASRISVTVRIATAIRGTLDMQRSQPGDQRRPSNPGKKRMN